MSDQSEPGIQDELEGLFGSQIGTWRASLELRVGRWCGPGEDASSPETGLDPCCRTHKEEYDRLGISYETMWTAANIVAAESADQALYDCMSSVGLSELSAEAQSYREKAVEAFQGRLTIAAWLRNR